MIKNILLLTGCLIALASCKKSGDGLSNTLMLGEVFRNGHLDAQYIYTSDNRLIRYNEYSASGNQSKLSLYVLYEYGAGGLVAKRKIFPPNDTLNNYYVLTHDNANRLSRADWYLTGSDAYEYRLFEYDQKGNMSKYTLKNGSTDDTKSYVEFTYDAEGRLTNQKNYVWNTDKFYLSSNIDFTPSGKNVYTHWQKYKMFPGDFFAGELNAEVKHTNTYNSSGVLLSDYTETATSRQYNGAGYLIKQTITKIFVKPANASEVRNMEYNYVQ